MKISLKWIKKYVDIPDNLKDFCDRLDLTGTGVEAVDFKGKQFDKIVTGEIIKKTPHPNSDHMFITLVDVGEEELLQIVCGAQNFNEGDHVVVALIGAILQNTFKIKKSKLRGIESFGMNCSEEELGLSDHSDGIMILPADAPIGVPIADYLNLRDTIIDCEITPNRPDCMSVLGLAREISAIYNTKYINPLDKMLNLYSDCPKCKKILPSINIIEKSRCPRYTLRLITDVKIGPSPNWLVERLNAMDCRSINNVVDVTNYILFLFGQPLHTFDYDKLDGDEIIIRPAKDNEKFVTLDNQQRILTSDMTVISTKNNTIALAGVMGGKNSEVDDNTCNILLECATFSPEHTSRTSRALGLISESSLRYERRVDDIPIGDISAAAASLIASISGGKVSEAFSDVWPLKTKRKKIIFRRDRFNKMMGCDIDRRFINQTLENLGCDVVGKFVCPPSYRPDLEREIDLYEEVLRIYGMDKIESSLPSSDKRIGQKNDKQIILDKLNYVMTSSGASETVSYSFSDINYCSIFGLYKCVKLINPLNKEQQVMRQSLIPGLLESVSFNINHGADDIALYEIGIVFEDQGSSMPLENKKVACVLSGQKNKYSWHDEKFNYDYFDAKGIVENIIDSLNIHKIKYKENNMCFLQKGQTCDIFSDGSYIGYIGQIHPNVLEQFNINQKVFCFELDVNILEIKSNTINDFSSISLYPGVNIDIALTLDCDVTNEAVTQAIKSAGGKLLKSVTLFDVYTNKDLKSQHKKSLAYSLKYNAFDRTLKHKEVEKIHNRLLKKVCSSTGAEIRS